MSLTLNPQLSKRGKVISLILFFVFTIAGISKGMVSVFYLLYLFWCDELLKTIFDGVAFISQRESIKDRTSFLSNLKGRFFLLMIYFVFIIVVFGMIINFKTTELIQHNFGVFFFQNPWFNLSLLTFFFRELNEALFKKENEIYSHHAFSPGILTLHLSIILGFLLFAFTAWRNQSAFTEHNNLSTILAIVPFLLIKLFFDYRAIQNEA